MSSRGRQVKQSLSVVIEWENVKNSEHSRAGAMLKSLLAQLKAAEPRLARPAEILLIHDAAESAAEDILASVAAETAGFPGQIRVESVEDLDYYKQKNFGAQKATGDLILFVDSDVVPDGDWLKSLLDCYDEEQADVVCGATHVEPAGLYGKTFALFWFFPLPSETAERRRADYFFANNVLFRRALLLEFPFPDTGLVRGRCTQLSETLRAHQKSIYLEGKAKVRHPPPNGLSHFVRRALCQGHDNVHGGYAQGVGSSLKRLKWHVGKAWRRIWANRREVRLGGAGAVAAMVISGAYFILEFVGEMVTYANPTLIGENIRV